MILPMRPGFTETLSAALLHADEQARRLGKDFVGTEHLLLGIITGKSGDAFKALQAETNIDQLLSRLSGALPKEAQQVVVTGRLPLSPKAQRAINTSISEAQAAGAAVVSTRFLLLTLLEEGETAVVEILQRSGADLDELRGMLSRPAESPEK
jgi:ATP-dependent Clp protease ATP-binding subunit ClpC